MTRLARLLTLAAVAALPAAALAAPAPIAGNWMTEDGVALVQVGQCGATLCGKIRKVLKPNPKFSRTDVNNPDKSKRAQPIVGLTVLSGFTADDDVWRGQIYDPKSGKTYRSVVRKNSNGTLKVEGCVGPFCKTQTWRPAR